MRHQHKQQPSDDPKAGAGSNPGPHNPSTGPRLLLETETGEPFGSRELKKGDIVRVRMFGTDDEWAYGVLEAFGFQPDGVNGSMALRILDGMVRTSGKGFIGGMLPIAVREGESFELLTWTPLELEVQGEVI